MAVALGLLAAPGGAAEVATDVRCGELIIRSVALAADLVCEGDGLVVGADGVTIDLGGHRLISTASTTPHAGTVAVEGHKNVTVRNGTIDGPGVAVVAVRVTNAKNVTLEDLHLSTVEGSLRIERSSGVVVRRVRFEDVYVRLRDAHGNVIRDNELFNSNGTTLLLRDSHRNVIEGNLIHANEAGGLALADSDANRIRANVVRDNGGEYGIDVRSGDRNRLEGNDASGGRSGGLGVRAAARRTLLAGNTASSNPHDGIDVLSASTTLRGNHAVGNGGWGIRAVAGVKDGHRNTAQGNAAGQCLNISCSAGNS